MYDGSLYGAGAEVFAVMGYVISAQVPDRKYGSQVTLNARKLADTLGETEDEIAKAIEFLCSPDPRSTTKKESGRRLIKIGEFEYQVVNGAKYRAIRDEEERREQNRDAKRRQRARENGEAPVIATAEAARLAADDANWPDAFRIDTAMDTPEERGLKDLNDYVEKGKIMPPGRAKGEGLRPGDIEPGADTADF